MFFNVIFIKISFLIISREKMQEKKEDLCLYGLSPEYKSWSSNVGKTEASFLLMELSGIQVMVKLCAVS